MATYRALASNVRADQEAALRMVLALPADCRVALRIEMLTQLGHASEALPLLEQFAPGLSPGRRPGNVELFLWNPALRPLWQEPGMRSFLRRHGWIDYWKASGTRPDLCNDGNRPAFCAQ